MDENEARRIITNTLEQLEIDTTQLVSHVHITRIDVTGLADTKPKIRCSVRIEMQRLPGQDWAKD